MEARIKAIELAISMYSTQSTSVSPTALVHAARVIEAYLSNKTPTVLAASISSIGALAAEADGPNG